MNHTDTECVFSQANIYTHTHIGQEAKTAGGLSSSSGAGLVTGVAETTTNEPLLLYKSQKQNKKINNNNKEKKIPVGGKTPARSGKDL